MATNDLATLNVVYRLGSVLLENVLAFKFKTSSSSLAGLAADFDSELLSTFLSGKHTSVSCDTLLARDVVPGTAAPVEYTVSPAKTGNNSSGDPLPPQCALVTTWRTALAGRSYRGRSYSAGLCENHQNAGTFDSSETTNAINIAQAILDRYGPSGDSADYQLVVLSRYHAGVKRVTPIGTVVTSFSVHAIVYNQRRRTIGRGI